MLRVFADGRLFGARTGAGEPWVLALHGWGRSHADFDVVLAGLDALAPDLPGFGATPPPPEAWGSDGYADLVAILLDETAPQIVLVGHSFGGRVAVRLAARHPQRIAALVLSGAPVAPRPQDAPRKKPATAFRAGRALQRAGLLGDARMEELRRRHGSVDYRAAEGMVRQVLVKVLAEEYATDLARVSCPVELVWGRADSETPLAAAEQLAAALPTALLHVCEEAGHLVPVEDPAALRAAIERHRPQRAVPACEDAAP